VSDEPLTAIPPGLEPPVPLSECFDAHYGLEITREELPEVIEARVAITDAVRQPNGSVHGGAIVAMAEALASRGTFMCVIGQGNIAVGLSNQTNYAHPVRDGHLRATARPRARDADQWIWEVETRDDTGAVCAVSTVTIAVRPLPQSA
jgi:1,4-dihydroxy-2-naphthoyl-CoA hydrolase